MGIFRRKRPRPGEMINFGKQQLVGLKKDFDELLLQYVTHCLHFAWLKRQYREVKELTVIGPQGLQGERWLLVGRGQRKKKKRFWWISRTVPDFLL